MRRSTQPMDLRPVAVARGPFLPFPNPLDAALQHPETRHSPNAAWVDGWTSIKRYLLPCPERPRYV
jgi:hypothetical protein